MAQIVSIQSHVLHGHVGNCAAVPAMRALGAQVTAVPTTLLSNHPHYPTMRGQILDAGLVADLLLGVEERGLAAHATVLVTGFMGSVAVGEVVADFVERTLSRNPDVIYVCDPVLGDDDLGGFADGALLGLFRERLLPLATVATPNGWEACKIAELPAAIGEMDLLQALRDRGLRDVVITGGSATDERLRNLVLEGQDVSAIETPRLPVRPAGTGDMFTGVLAAQLGEGARLENAARRATAMTFAMLERTPPTPWAEMPIESNIDSVARMASPFAPVPIGTLT